MDLGKSLNSEKIGSPIVLIGLIGSNIFHHLFFGMRRKIQEQVNISTRI